jgi:hypothetical protein
MEEFASKKEDDFEFEFELGNGTKLIFPRKLTQKHGDCFRSRQGWSICFDGCI